MIELGSNIKNINRVGQATASRLKRLDIETVKDLLYYFPFRYDDYSETTPIAKLSDGQKANIVGHIEIIQNKRSSRKKMLITEAIISDDTDSIKAVWFNQPYIAKALTMGTKVSLSGKVKYDISGLSLASPNYEKIDNQDGIHTQGLVPQYHLTANLTQKQIRFLTKQILPLIEQIEDWLPPYIRSDKKFVSLSEAIKTVHFPKDQKKLNEARRRLAFEELFLVQIKNQLAQKEFADIRSPKLKFQETIIKKFVSSLPFTLTKAQRSSAWEIIQNMENDKPMSRLLEGDVGSGKTVVAAIAMLNAASQGTQAALMVPTEILAQQHYHSLRKLFSQNKLNIALLTRSYRILHDKPVGKKEMLEAIKKGKTDIIVGTHSLIQESLKFKRLGLAIIDEQHRFGVEQRAKLLNFSGTDDLSPHLLSMTATPIPRSLAMALYGDLDISIINELPKGRKKILTKVVPEEKRQKAYQFILQEIKKGRQVYVLCPLIDYSDKLGVKSVNDEFKKLNEYVFPNLNIGMLHGRMKAKEKEEVMKDFLANKKQILVSTSVIEVGVDVPNASIMMIEGADRFGLAQLHQFRGRVGRGEHQSYCLLFSESSSEKTMERLNALTEHNDGFELAKIDLKYRGPGEIYGAMQKGFPELKQASLFDYTLMNEAKEEAKKIFSIDPTLEKWPLLKKEVAWEMNSVYLSS